MADSVDPDGTSPYEPSHQDLHCLQKSVFVSRLKGLTKNVSIKSTKSLTLTLIKVTVERAVFGMNL